MPLEFIADEKLRADPSISKFADGNALAKAYTEAQALLGASIRVPGPDAGAEDVAAFRTKVMKHVPDAIVLSDDPAVRAKLEPVVFEKLGRPKEAKEYSAPAGAAIPDAVLEGLRAEAQEMGLTKGQFEARAKKVAEQLLKASAAEKAELEALKKELGAAFDERVAAGKGIAEKLGVPKELLERMGPAQLRVWVKAAEAIGGEEGPLGGQKTLKPGSLTPAEARAQADEILQRVIREGNGMDPALKRDLMQKHEALVRVSMTKAA